MQNDLMRARLFKSNASNFMIKYSFKEFETEIYWFNGNVSFQCWKIVDFKVFILL